MSEEQPSGWAIGWTAFAGITMIMVGGCTNTIPAGSASTWQPG